MIFKLPAQSKTKFYRSKIMFFRGHETKLFLKMSLYFLVNGPKAFESCSFQKETDSNSVLKNSMEKIVREIETVMVNGQMVIKCTKK